MEALTHYVLGKMQHPPNFLSILMHILKHIDAIKIFHISNNSRM